MGAYVLATIFRHRSGSTLAQVMACCLRTPSHYLNQCWLIIREVLWYPPQGNFTANAIVGLSNVFHDDVIKWKHFPRYWPFVRGIHRSPVNSPHKGQWRGAVIFSLICLWINGWVNNREAGDLRLYRAHYDVIVMLWHSPESNVTRQTCIKPQQNTTRHELTVSVIIVMYCYIFYSRIPKHSKIFTNLCLRSPWFWIFVFVKNNEIFHKCSDLTEHAPALAFRFRTIFLGTFIQNSKYSTLSSSHWSTLPTIHKRKL